MKKIFTSTNFFRYTFWTLFLLAIMLLSAFITMKIIIRGEVITVPNLTGETVEKAKVILLEKGLYLKQKSTQFSDKFSQGKIISQNPAPGSKLKRNKIVKVTVSAGSERIIVPDLVGKTLRAAEIILKERNLTKGLVAQAHSSRYSTGHIMAQNPEKATEKERTFPINLLVSQGGWEKKYIMPDLIGKELNWAITKLKERGFKVGTVRYTHYPGLDPETIIKQLPPSGYRVQKKILISFEVSR
ncbi:MAG: PASTA domain-containing protein [Candidatus Aminicenantia bacterium]